MPVNANAFAWSRKLQGASHAIMQVQLIGPSGRKGSVHGALLDTGASYSMFSSLLASQAGYSVAGLGTTTVTLADGNLVVVHYIPNARLLVEGHPVTMGRLLLQPAKGMDLLCPDDFLQATEFAFDTQKIFFD